MFFSRFFTRKFARTSVRRNECLVDCGGMPGSNLPFSLNHSRYKMTAYFALFFAFPTALPFIVLRHHLVKNQGDAPPVQEGQEEDALEKEDE